MPSANTIRLQTGPAQPQATSKFTEVARINRHERLRKSRRFGQLTGTKLTQIIDDLERGYPEDWADLCKHMVRSEPRLASVYSTRKTRVSGSKWAFKPGFARNDREKLQAEAAAKFCTEQFQRIANLERVWKNLLDGIGVGFSVGELDWQPTTAGVNLRGVTWRSQRRFLWGDNYEFRLAKQPGDRIGDELVRDKFVVHAPSEHADYPPMTGAFLPVAWYWLFKHWAIEWWVQGTERSGSPIIYGLYKDGTEESVREKFLADLERLSADHVGVLPEGLAIVVEAAGSASFSGDQAPHKNFSDYMDDQIELAIIGMTDATGSDATGARAATETRASLTLDPRMVDDGKQLMVTVERDILPPMLRFNAHLFEGTVPPVPEGAFVFRDVDFEITPEIATAKAASLNELRRAGGLPALPGRDRPLLDEERERVPIGLPPAGGSAPATSALPAGGQASPVPFQGGGSEKGASSNSRTRPVSTHPIASVLSGASVDPASARHRQLSIPFRR